MLVFDLDGRLLLHLQHAGHLLSFTWRETRFPTSLWSPSGERLAYVVEEHMRPSEAGEPQAPGTSALIVADATRGVLASIPAGQWPHWSAERDQLAYYRALDDALAVYEPGPEEEKVLAHGLRPLAWAFAGKKLLVAANYTEMESESGIGWLKYEANLLDPASGQMTRVQELDNNTEFWLSPDGATAVLLTTGPSLAILDLSSLGFSSIAGSVISYPSDHIPQSQLAFSPDSSQIYWFDGNDAIYKANRDGSGLTQVGRLTDANWFLGFSPDVTGVLYTVLPAATPPPQGGPYPWDSWVANVDGSDARLVAEKASEAAWRSQPSLEEPGPR